MNSFLAISALITCLSLASGYSDGSWLSIELLHAIDPENPHIFSVRGNATDSENGEFNIVQNDLNAADRRHLRVLAEQNKFYRLKAIVSASDGRRDAFLTFSSACALVKSQLNDVIWIATDHEGEVIGINQSVNGGSATCSMLTKNDEEALFEFNTDIQMKRTENAPIPDTASFIQKVEREREARERGEVKDNRGFFAKYWMYIVPVVILLLISGSANQEGGGGGR